MLLYNDWIGSDSIEIAVYFGRSLRNSIYSVEHAILLYTHGEIRHHCGTIRRAHSDESVRWCADMFKFLIFQEPRGCRIFRHISCGGIDYSREANNYAGG